MAGKRPASVAATRRDLLKGAGLSAALLGSGVANAGDDHAAGAATKVDVVIVGAGFSGLAAARQLTKAGKSVVVLEARDRVGGRTKPGRIAGHTIDLGGMWVGPTQKRLIALGEEYGAKRYATPVAGAFVAEIAGEIRKADGGLPLDPATLADFARVTQEIDRMAAEVSVDAPWSAPNAKAMDAKTYQAWIEEVTQNPRTRGLLDRIGQAIFASDISAFSLLYFLFYLRSGDDLATIIARGGEGAQKWLYHGGVHQIARRIADELGDRVVLSSPVEHIRQHDAGVEVAAAGRRWRASQVIVAVPPALCSRIGFSPALPAAREKLTQRYPMGSVIKFWVAYERPFWRDRGMSGYSFSDSSAMAAAIDATPDGAKVGLLAGFIEGANAVAWGPKGTQARRDFIVGEITRLQGPEGANPIDYIDNDWPSEEWSRGCYSGNATPGTLSLFGTALRAPAGRIHWASTETSAVWAGYIDGAIRAGERAATEAAAALRA